MTNIEYMMRIFNDDRLEGICYKHAAHDEDGESPLVTVLTSLFVHWHLVFVVYPTYI